jgi:hypothetical protein
MIAAGADEADIRIDLIVIHIIELFSKPPAMPV